jgi:hypothetical protein
MFGAECATCIHFTPQDGVQERHQDVPDVSCSCGVRCVPGRLPILLSIFLSIQSPGMLEPSCRALEPPQQKRCAAVATSRVRPASSRRSVPGSAGRVSTSSSGLATPGSTLVPPVWREQPYWAALGQSRGHTVGILFVQELINLVDFVVMHPVQQNCLGQACTHMEIGAPEVRREQATDLQGDW